MINANDPNPIYPIGCKVQLNSGGPMMIIVDLNEKTGCDCTTSWRDGDGNIQEHEWNTMTLRPYVIHHIVDWDN
jgi:uncharacterized protein YodC (DUF2158 family)